jgi:dihydrofolate reductase
MRRILMFNRVSADGYFASPDGKLDWVVPDPELDRSAAESIAEDSVDAILFGRRTYEMFASFWPHALEESSSTASDPHNPGRRAPEMKAMAVMLNETPKIVFSRTMKEVTWKNSRIVKEFDPREIEAMKKAPGKDIMIFGSGSLVSQLTEHGLIDDYQFIVAPVFLGAGRSLIRDVPNRSKLRLTKCQQFPTGNVMLRYERAS